MRRLMVSVAASVLFLFGGSLALAGGPPLVNSTVHFVNRPNTFIDIDPCTGMAAQISVVETGVMHITVLPDGTAHFTQTARGTFSFDVLVSATAGDGVVDATGTFVFWSGGNGTFDALGNPIGKAEFAFTLNGRGTRTSDGTTFRFHNNGHAVFDGSGATKLMFFNLKAHCG